MRSPRSPEKRPLRVLVVEDDGVLRRMEVWLLEQAGMTVIAAADGHEGLERALSDAPDVILLDLILPGCSGLEVLRRYRREGGRAGILVLTAVTGEKLAQSALDAGADFLLMKPANWEEVLFAVRTLGEGPVHRYEELLCQMGASVKWGGVSRTARCAQLLGEEEGLLLKELYCRVAAEERSDWRSVAKSMERVIRLLHAKGTPLYQRMMNTTPEEKRPGGREFLLGLVRAARIPLKSDK